MVVIKSWVVVDGCRWLWVVVGGCRWFHCLVQPKLDIIWHMVTLSAWMAHKFVSFRKSGS